MFIMVKYEYLEHTADVKFRAYGKTLEEAFKSAAYAYADVVSDHTKISQNVIHKINIKSEDKKALLYDFIEQLIILLDTDNFLLAKVSDIKIQRTENGFLLKAEFVGDNKPEKYTIDTHVKAVTYQEMLIEETPERVMVQVVLDL